MILVCLRIIPQRLCFYFAASGDEAHRNRRRAAHAAQRLRGPRAGRRRQPIHVEAAGCRDGQHLAGARGARHVRRAPCVGGGGGGHDGDFCVVLSCWRLGYHGPQCLVVLTSSLESLRGLYDAEMKPLFTLRESVRGFEPYDYRF